MHFVKELFIWKNFYGNAFIIKLLGKLQSGLKLWRPQPMGIHHWEWAHHFFKKFFSFLVTFIPYKLYELISMPINHWHILLCITKSQESRTILIHRVFLIFKISGPSCRPFIFKFWLKYKIDLHLSLEKNSFNLRPDCIKKKKQDICMFGWRLWWWLISQGLFFVVAFFCSKIIRHQTNLSTHNPNICSSKTDEWGSQTCPDPQFEGSGPFVSYCKACIEFVFYHCYLFFLLCEESLSLLSLSPHPLSPIFSFSFFFQLIFKQIIIFHFGGG